ncbi:hypothetical protein [Paucisalibacillus globulus]|uniref:hypothetical protein n=1 Tax=Paucisalibacillus globulus TaxID=351095 RepID=UPI000414D1D2|nr:hypothetical protein [Paucisalibacillus globulus]
MEKVPVMVFQNKENKDRYLANGPDNGDWSDENLDVLSEDIECAMMFWRNDRQKPTDEDLEELKQESINHKKNMIARFGDSAVISFDVEEWLKHYTPVNIEITKEQFNKARELD